MYDTIQRMHYTFLQTPLFTSRWKAMGLTDEDLRMLEQELLRSAPGHPVMAGTGGCERCDLLRHHGDAARAGQRECATYVLPASIRSYWR